MISYAQNLEDVVLNRVFSDVERGTYIDVGAAHPTFDSVTRTFYDRGWTGINLEPRENEFHLLMAQRPKDINLQIGISDEPGHAPFFEVNALHVDRSKGDQGGLSTFDHAIADEHARKNRMQVVRHDREVKTLGQTLREQGIEEATFLKIDVEGWERRVLRGMDWSYCRPRVVLVESTLPMTSTAAHDEWESLLTDHAYSFTLFDGLNRFYLREEDESLRPLMEVPANVLDNYTPYRLVQLIELADEIRSKLNALDNAGARASFQIGLKLGKLLSRAKRRVGITK